MEDRNTRFLKVERVAGAERNAAHNDVSRINYVY